MNRFTRRPSAALAVAMLALFVALGGSAIAKPVAKMAKQITGRDIKNKSITATDILPGTLGTDQVGQGSLNGGDLKDGSVTRADVDQSTLSKVAGADKVDGKDASDFVASSTQQRFYEKLHVGDVKQVAKAGTITIFATCDNVSNAGTPDDPSDDTYRVRLITTTSQNGATQVGTDSLTGGSDPSDSTSYLNTDTDESDRILYQDSSTTPYLSDSIDAMNVLDPNGVALTSGGKEGIVGAVKLAGADCLAAGVFQILGA
jgi:hypothetical protein